MTLAVRIGTSHPPLQVMAAVRHESNSKAEGGPNVTGVEFLNINRSERLQIVSYLLSNLSN